MSESVDNEIQWRKSREEKMSGRNVEIYINAWEINVNDERKENKISEKIFVITSVIVHDWMTKISYKHVCRLQTKGVVIINIKKILY